MFSIDQLVAQPPLSLIISLLLIFGLDLIGSVTLKKLGFFSKKNKNWARWQATIVATMLLAIILYPLALIGLTSRVFFQQIGIFCLVLGFFQLSCALKWLYMNNKKLNAFWKIVWAQAYARKLWMLMILGMGFLAMGPITHPDAADYHFGVPIAILNNGGIPVMPEWFFSRLAGNGEVLTALALSVGSEQFTSLLQYVSLLSIISIIFFFAEQKSKARFLYS